MAKRRRRLPKSFKLGNFEFQVRYRDLTKELAHGQCNLNEFLVEINQESHPNHTYNTLIHEYIEAINGVYDLGLSHKTISTLATGLCQILETERYT